MDGQTDRQTGGQTNELHVCRANHVLNFQGRRSILEKYEKYSHLKNLVLYDIHVYTVHVHVHVHVPGRHSDSLDSSLKDKCKESEQIQNNIAIISFSFSL